MHFNAAFSVANDTRAMVMVVPTRSTGGWAYPGTMVVGDGGKVVNGTLVGGMNKHENQVHFGGWCTLTNLLGFTENLLENTDGVLRHQCSLGVAACCLYLC